MKHQERGQSVPTTAPFAPQAGMLINRRIVQRVQKATCAQEEVPILCALQALTKTKQGSQRVNVVLLGIIVAAELFEPNAVLGRMAIKLHNQQDPAARLARKDTSVAAAQTTMSAILNSMAIKHHKHQYLPDV